MSAWFRILMLAAGVAPMWAAQQTPLADPPAPLAFSPRDYFVDHCQRCHGVDGVNYEGGFAGKDTDAALRADIDRMAKGPGGFALSDKQEDVQIAYHRLISDGLPFISWTGQSGLTLSGEVTDGAKLAAQVGDAPLDISVDDKDHWKLRLGSASDLPNLKLTATLEKKSSVLEPAKLPYVVKPNPKPNG